MKTFWVARNDGDLIVYQREPRPPGSDPDFPSMWIEPEGPDMLSGTVPLAHYACLGLPKEPAPGECWEVTWKDDGIWIRQYDEEPRRVLVPFAREVGAKIRVSRDS